MVADKGSIGVGYLFICWLIGWLVSLSQSSLLLTSPCSFPGKIVEVACHCLLPMAKREKPMAGFVPKMGLEFMIS